MSRTDVQELQDRASEHYLRGEYREAREAWEKVLLLEPENEEAAEGIRLSGVYIEGTEGMPSDLGAQAPPAVPVDMGSETMQVDRSVLDSLTKPPPASPGGDLERQGDGFDLGTLEELDAIPLFTTPPPTAAPRPAAVAAVAAVSVTESEAANELNRRVQDLLAEARALHEGGKNQEALGVIARIAILDEENAAAHELEGNVRTAMERAVLQVDGWIAEGVQAFDRGEIEAARGLFERVLAAAPEHREALHYMEALPTKGTYRPAPGSPAPGAVPGSEPFQSEELLPDMAQGAPPEPPKKQTAEDVKRKLVEELGGSIQAVPLARPAGFAAAKPQGSSRDKAVAIPSSRMATGSRRMPLLLGVVVLALAGLGAWWWLGSSKEGGQEPVAQASQPAPSRPAKAPLAEPPPAAADSRSVGQILGDARKLMASGDYAKAVVEFDRALKVDPQNGEAKEGLAQAGEAYKVRKMEQEQLDRVKMAFADQEYTSALRLVYRLPASIDKAQVDRYKTNGWFNLGVVALRAGECQQARTHFGEALAVSPGDEDAKRLRAFAERYQDVPKDRTFYDQVESLEFRGVDD